MRLPSWYGDEPSMFGSFYFMVHFNNFTLSSLTEVVDGILNIEKWEDIKGYEGLYKISSFGRVKSLSNNKLKKDKILKQGKNHAGYLHVSLSKNNKRITKRVSRMVGIYFIPNPENKQQINHKKGIRTDNRAWELEWATSSENMKHSFCVLKRQTPNFGGYSNKRKVKQINPKTGEVIKIFDSVSQAQEETKIKKVSSVATRIEGRKTAGGFKWEYV